MSGIASVVGIELFKTAVLAAYDYCTKEAGLKLKQWNTERQIESLYKKIYTIRKVKTIWQVDKAVDLFAFYCDSHVILGKKRLKIRAVSDFADIGNVVIQGIAGQGKSILLRYLCSIELCRGEYIPIFVELSRIRSTSNLKDRIDKSFQSLGLNIDEPQFDALASSGRLLLLLDAFDEIPDELKSQVLTDIEDLASKHDKLRIIVTSRPNYKIQNSNLFTVVQLDNLKNHEYRDVIVKLAHRDTWAHDLIEHIENRATHVKPLLCTPLMVTLLVISYKSSKKLPAKLSDFYDSIFITLLQRHDGTKPSCIRPRSCDLDDNEYREGFEAFCIVAKSKGSESLVSGKINELTKEALRVASVTAKPLSFLEDIIKITCLIVRDGEEYRFIHKTVQEYYTSSYIQKKPEAWVTKFYGRIKGGHSQWRQELDFLSEIDTYRYNRYYKLPALLQLLQVTEDELSSLQTIILSPAAIKKILGRLCINLNEIEGNNRGGFSCAWSDTNEFNSNFIHQLVTQNLREHYEQLRLLVNEYPEIVKSYKGTEIDKAVKKVVYVSDAIEKGAIESVLVEVQAFSQEMLKQGKAVVNCLRKEENSSLLDGLL